MQRIANVVTLSHPLRTQKNRSVPDESLTDCYSSQLLKVRYAQSDRASIAQIRCRLSAETSVVKMVRHEFCKTGSRILPGF